MNRVEALSVLREILDVFKESVAVDLVSLDFAPKIEQRKSGFYEIKMKFELDSQSRECLQLILDKHKLSIKESRGLVTIYRHQP